VATKVDVYKLMDKIGWANGKYGNDMDGQTNLGMPAIWRIWSAFQMQLGTYVMGSTDKIFEEASKRNFTNKDANDVAWNKNFVSWTFADGKPVDTPTASNVSFEFWSNKADYNVEWKYDKVRNAYLRFNGGKELQIWIIVSSFLLQTSHLCLPGGRSG